MEHFPNEQNMKDKVLASIREKRVSMHSTSYFKAEFAFLVLVSAIALLLSIAIVSFILFGLRVNGHEALLGFGSSGLDVFIHVFPWPLLALDILLLIFIQKLLRKFKFGYRSPMLYVLGALAVVALSTAFVLDRGTPLNDLLEEHAQQGDLPGPFSDLYGNARVPVPHDRGIYRGVITSIATDTIMIEHDDLDTDTDDSNLTIYLPPHFDTRMLHVGEMIYAACRVQDGRIEAYGIKKISTAK